jgi:hypothetical protein
MPPTFISPSGEQHWTIEEKMEVIAKVPFPTKADDFNEAIYPNENPTNNLNQTRTNNRLSLEVMPNISKTVITENENSSASRIDGTGWQGLKIWFFFDPSGLCDMINLLIETGLPPELNQARVVVFAKPGRRNCTRVKAYHYISLLPMIAKLVEKAMTLHISTQGDVNEWWHTGQHGSRAGRNTTDDLDG